MPEKHRYIRKCDPKPPGRKRINRKGKMCLPSQLEWQRAYYKRNREAILKKAKELVTTNPVQAVERAKQKKNSEIRRVLREIEAQKAPKRKAA